MLLYQGTSKEFVIETTKNEIVDRLEESFKRQMGYGPSVAERRSWQNSLRAMALVVGMSGLKNNGVGIEYQLPGSSKRLDFMISGLSLDKKKEAVIIELKQWEKTEAGDGDKVVTFVGQRDRDVLHPSVQVGHYRQYLTDQLEVLHEGNTAIRLSACSYLHNYSLEEKDPLFDEKFKAVVAKNPVFSKDDVEKLVEYLNALVPCGDDGSVVEEIIQIIPKF